MTFDTHGHTMMGVSPEKALEALSGYNVLVLGGNCGNGPEEIVPVSALNTVEAAAQALADSKRVVVARLGVGGALAAGPGGPCHVPAFPTSVVDTLGAGDAFDGGFIAARLAECDLSEALRWGNAVAALKIRRPGARATPSRAEVDRLLRESN